jgi:hypothetical protein
VSASDFCGSVLGDLVDTAVARDEVAIVVVDDVGVGQFQVEEGDRLRLKERADVPGAAVQLDR